MTRIRSTIRVHFIALFSLAFAVASVPAAIAAQPKSHAATKKAAEPPKPVGEVVQYPDLETRIGSEVVIETTLKTVRRGKLIKYTQPVLTIQLGPESGSIELSVPRETIKTITVVAPTPPADTNEGKAGAKKN